MGTLVLCSDRTNVRVTVEPLFAILDAAVDFLSVLLAPYAPERCAADGSPGGRCVLVLTPTLPLWPCMAAMAFRCAGVFHPGREHAFPVARNASEIRSVLSPILRPWCTAGTQGGRSRRIVRAWVSAASGSPLVHGYGCLQTLRLQVSSVLVLV